jgi:NAD(P)H-nitrite reductase large subunit
MRYLIIGNSAAAIGTIEGIRLVDKTGEITVLSKEKYHTYSRPLISYYLNNKTDLERMKYRNDDFYTTNNVSFYPSTTVTAIDAKAKFVTTDSGKKFNFDKLMIATGSNPFVPSFKGLDTVKNKFTFASLDDALELEKELGKDKKVLIIGAGLIGLKCAEGIFDRVKDITVVDMSNKVLSSILDDEGSAVVKEFLVKKGLNFILSNSIDSFDGNKATTSDGKIIDFDILVLAIGVRTNVSLAVDCGLKTNRGIIVDKYLKTSDNNIYSAGDCSEGYDMLLETNRVLPLLPNAYMQGECAGQNMAGKDVAYETGIPMNAIGFFGLHILSAGLYIGDAIIKKTDDSYKILFYKDNYLKGFIIIGDCGRAGIYTSIIREKISLNDLDFKMLADKPQLIALNNNILCKKLGENL